MAKRKTPAVETPTVTPEPTPESNGTPAPARQAKRGEKQAVVKKALAKGIESPRQISEYALKKHGLEITPGHVSAIKATLRKKEGSVPTGEPETVVPLPPGGRKSADTGSLTGEYLIELARLAERAGGVERIQAHLDILKEIR